MKIKSFITPVNFFGFSLAVLVASLVFANIQVKNLLNSSVFADTEDGITACVQNWANDYNNHVQDRFPAIEAIIQDPGYAYYAPSLPLDFSACVTACTGNPLYEGQLSSYYDDELEDYVSYTCDDYCNAYSMNMNNPLNLPQCHAMFEAGYGNLCKVILGGESSCSSNCSGYTSHLVGDATCADVCTAISDDLYQADAACAASIPSALNDPVDYQTGSCEDFYTSCNYSSSQTYIQYVNSSTGNCTNLNYSDYSCPSVATSNTLDTTCKANCLTSGFTQAECYALCSRRTVLGCGAVCDSINNSNYGGSNNCSNACSRTEITPEPTPTPEPPSFTFTRSSNVTSLNAFNLTGVAQSTGSNIAFVSIRPYTGDENSWVSCSADDESFDSTSENITCALSLPTDHTHYTFELKITDTNETSNTTPIYYEIYRTSLATLKSYFALNSLTPVVDSANYIGDENNAVLGDDYSLGTGYDGIGFTLTSGRAVITDSSGLLDFSSAGDKFTVEAWVKSSAYTGQDYRRVVSKSNQDGNEDVWAIGIDGNGGLYCKIITTGDTYTGVETNDTQVLTADTWTRIKCTYNSTTGELAAYIDDEKIKSEYSPEGYRSLLTSTAPIFIGNNPDLSRQFSGSIDNVLIYSDVISTPPVPDVTGPIVTLDNSLENKHQSSFANTVTITGTATDSAGVVTSVQAYNGSEYQSCSITSGSGTLNTTFSCTVTVAGTSEVDITFRSQDSSLNYTSTTPHFFFTPNQSITNNTFVDISFSGGTQFNDQNNYITEATQLGTLASSTRLSAGDASYFDGSDKLTFFDPASNLDFSGTESSFSAEVWIKPDSSPTGNQIIAQKLNNTNTEAVWELGINSNLQLYAKVRGEKQLISTRLATSISEEHKPGEYTDSLIPTVDTVPQWANVKMAFNGDTKTLSVRVNNKETVNTVFQLDNALPASTGKFIVGGDFSNNDYNWRGSMSNLKLYNTGDSAAPYIVVTSDYSDRERVTDTTPTFNIDFSDNSRIVSAEYYVSFYYYDDDIDSRAWTNITTPNDGQWDSTHEQYTVNVDNLLSYAPEARQATGDTDSSWYLLVRAVDENGNQSYYNNGWLTAYESTNYGMAAYRFVTENFDFTPPDIFAHTIIPNRTIDRNPTIRGYVRDYKIINQGETASNIQSIEYRINGGSWTSVQPLDGTFNSPSEEFNIQLNNIEPGDYSYDIRATDASGNITGSGTNGTDHPIVSGTFTILNPISVPQVESIIREVNFTTRDLQDPIFTTAVWGNGIARLRQTLSFTATNLIPNLNEDFGAEYGDSKLNLHKGSNNNLWLVSNTDKIIYFNTTTNTSTVYPTSIFKSGGEKPNDVYEFSIGSNKYLMLMYDFTTSNVLCQLNNNPENVIDSSSCVDYGTGNPNFRKFTIFGVDTRTSGHTGLYGGVNNDIVGNDISFAYIDTHDDPLNVAGYSVRYWGLADGIDRPGHLNAEGQTGDPVNNNATTFFFDQSRGNIIESTYLYGTFICSDGGNPLNITASDSNCLRPIGEYNYLDPGNQHYSIDMDDQGRYWFGGNQGLYMYDPEGKTSTDDDLFTEIIAKKDIANEEISKIEWIPGEYPIGDEIFYVTRSGHMRVIETNDTPTDDKDDTNYDYQLPLPPTRMGNAASWILEDPNTSWILAQGRGLYRIDADRDYEDQNVIEFLPTPPEGVLEINNITLSQVNGTVSEGSAYTFNDLVSYQVSNDDGTTWLPISIGQTVKFSQPGYKLKVRITFTRGSTPILDYVKLNYYAYPDANTRIALESTTNSTPQNSGGSGNNTTSTPQCFDNVPGSAPKIITALPEGKGKVRLFFAGAKDPVTNYTLEFSVIKGATQFGASNIGPRGIGDYLVQHLNPGTTYYFRIRAANGCTASAWSNEIKYKAPFTAKATAKQLSNAQSQVLAMEKTVGRVLGAKTVFPDMPIFATNSNSTGNTTKTVSTKDRLTNMMTSFLKLISSMFKK